MLFRSTLMALDDSAGAWAHYEADLVLTRTRAAANPGDVALQRELALSHARAGSVLLSLDDAAAALHHWRTVVEIRQRLARALPRDAQAQLDWAAAGWQLANLPPAVADANVRRAALRSGVDTLRQLRSAGRLPASAKEWPLQFEAALKAVDTLGE